MPLDVLLARTRGKGLGGDTVSAEVGLEAVPDDAFERLCEAAADGEAGEADDTGDA